MKILQIALCIGLANAYAQTGPGGVGTTDGTSSLVLWLDANTVSGTSGTTITSWSDRSGYGNNFTQGNGAVFNTNNVNGYPSFNFNGSSHYFQAPFSATLSPATLTILAATNVTSSGGFKTIISNRHDPPGSETRGYILYALSSTNNWSFWTGHRTNTIWEQMNSNLSTAGSWSAVTAEHQAGTDGKKLYVNNTLNVSSTPALNLNDTNPIRVGAGRNEGTPTFFFSGKMGEVIVYNVVLNKAQRIIVNNYLAAKYAFALTSDDIYTRDDVGFDHDVAGIGRTDATNIHDDSQGTGIVRISNPTNLDDNEFLMWGHDNGTVSTLNTTDVRSPALGRLERVWSVTETGDVGDVNIQFDLSKFATATASDLRLLIDTDDDGIFDEGSTVVIDGASDVGGNKFLFSGVSALSDQHRFTLGTINLVRTALPIELASFKGEISNGHTELRWTTTSERNNDFFTLERSVDGKRFDDLKKIPGSGTTHIKKHYSCMDDLVPDGRIYYRLKQTDYDGKSTYSKVIALTNAVTGPRVLAIPNPVKAGESVLLKISVPEKVDNSSLTVKLIDMLGREIPVDVHTRAFNELVWDIDPAARRGVYIVRVTSPALESPLFVKIQID